MDSLYLKILSLPPVHFLEDSLCHIHDVSHLPWWAVILIFTGTLRMAIASPAHITAQKVVAKRYLMMKEMDEEIIPELKRATSRHVVINKWTETQAKTSFRRVSKKIYNAKVIEHNCHFAKMFLPIYIQIPIWVFTSVGIRNMALMRASQDRAMTAPIDERFVQLSSEGIGWIPNLCLPDETLILPVLVGALFASTVLVSSNRVANTGRISTAAPQKFSKITQGMTVFLYCLSVAMIPITAMQPAALAIYWATSGAAGLGINLMTMSPKFRRFVNIPKIPLEPEKPYSVLKENIINKFKRISTKH